MRDRNRASVQKQIGMSRQVKLIASVTQNRYTTAEMQTALAHQTQLEVKAAFKEEQLCTQTNEHNFPLSVLTVLQSTAEGCHVPVHHQKHQTTFTSYSKKEVTNLSD